jgi:hypothetical protein
MCGCNVQHSEIIIDEDDHSRFRCLTADKEIVDISEIFSHAAFSSKHVNVIELLSDLGANIKDISEGKSKLWVLKGMTYEADDNSGLGKGQIHCTPNFGGTGNPRHDFVEVDVEYEERSGQIVKGKQLAQVVACFQETQYDRNAPSKYYAFLQYLELETVNPPAHAQKKKKNVNNELHGSIFKKYKWEYTTYNGRIKSHPVISHGMVMFSSITQLVWVVPDFKSIEVQHSDNLNIGSRIDYVVKGARDDRYWYVPRSFTDRSGWNIEVEAHFKLRAADDLLNNNDNPLQDHLLAQLVENHSVNQGNRQLRLYDVGEIDLNDGDEQDDGNNNNNYYY